MYLQALVICFQCCVFVVGCSSASTGLSFGGLAQNQGSGGFGDDFASVGASGGFPDPGAFGANT